MSVAGNKVFTMGQTGGSTLVFCLDRATGKRLWEAKIGRAGTGGYAGSRCTPTVDGDLVYALAPQGEFVCLNAAKKGAVVWRKDFEKDYGGRPGNWRFLRVAPDRRRKGGVHPRRKGRDHRGLEQEDRRPYLEGKRSRRRGPLFLDGHFRGVRD